MEIPDSLVQAVKDYLSSKPEVQLLVALQNCEKKPEKVDK
jgi:hypothetical protein